MTDPNPNAGEGTTPKPKKTRKGKETTGLVPVSQIGSGWDAEQYKKYRRDTKQFNAAREDWKWIKENAGAFFERIKRLSKVCAEMAKMAEQECGKSTGGDYSSTLARIKQINELDIPPAEFSAAKWLLGHHDKGEPLKVLEQLAKDDHVPWTSAASAQQAVYAEWDRREEEERLRELEEELGHRPDKKEVREAIKKAREQKAEEREEAKEEKLNKKTVGYMLCYSTDDKLALVPSVTKKTSDEALAYFQENIHAGRFEIWRINLKGKKLGNGPVRMGRYIEKPAAEKPDTTETDNRWNARHKEGDVGPVVADADAKAKAAEAETNGEPLAANGTSGTVDQASANLGGESGMTAETTIFTIIEDLKVAWPEATKADRRKAREMLRELLDMAD